MNLDEASFPKSAFPNSEAEWRMGNDQGTSQFICTPPGARVCTDKPSYRGRVSRETRTVALEITLKSDEIYGLEIGKAVWPSRDWGVEYLSEWSCPNGNTDPEEWVHCKDKIGADGGLFIWLYLLYI